MGPGVGFGLIGARPMHLDDDDGEDAAVQDERWQEVFRRLGVLEQQGARNGALLENLNLGLAGDVKRHQDVLYGTEQDPGLLTRVHALETTVQQRGRMLMAIVTLVVGAAGTMIVSRLEGCDRILHDNQYERAPATRPAPRVQP